MAITRRYVPFAIVMNCRNNCGRAESFRFAFRDGSDVCPVGTDISSDTRNIIYEDSYSPGATYIMSRVSAATLSLMYLTPYVHTREMRSVKNELAGRL